MSLRDNMKNVWVSELRTNEQGFGDGAEQGSQALAGRLQFLKEASRIHTFCIVGFLIIVSALPNVTVHLACAATLVLSLL